MIRLTRIKTSCATTVSRTACSGVSHSIPYLNLPTPILATYIESYLRCGKDRVSAYLGPAAQYIEVDSSTGKLTRWNVEMSSVVGSKTHGFAITDEEKISWLSPMTKTLVASASTAIQGNTQTAIKVFHRLTPQYVMGTYR
jgi:hypothetical protein